MLQIKPLTNQKYTKNKPVDMFLQSETKIWIGIPVGATLTKSCSHIVVGSGLGPTKAQNDCFSRFRYDSFSYNIMSQNSDISPVCSAQLC